MDYKNRAKEKLLAAKHKQKIDIEKERREANQAYYTEHHVQGGGNIRDFLLGFNDGLVSIFSLLAGVVGANVSPKIVILAGFAGLSAGAASMGLNNYISYKSQVEFYKSEIQREREEIKNVPEREKAEIREIYRRKGFKGKDLDLVVNKICSNKNIWVKVMVEEELGLMESKFDSPTKIAIITGVSFIIGAMIPISPYLLTSSSMNGFLISIITSITFMFIIGAIKTIITKKNWLKSGIEMVLIGALSSTIAYFVGGLF